MTFDVFSFDRRIVAGIESCGYVTPTPIQNTAIPAIMQGRDLMGLAQTGTGKTAAFVLPILQRLLTAKVSGLGPVRALVLAPTRELALQIHESFMQLGKRSGIRSATVYGGVGFIPQIRAAQHATVIVACPGRLVALMNEGSVNLDHVETLVLDEADRMLDMGFMPDIKRIIAKLPAKRQNLLFSATMPRDIRAFADQILVKPEVVQMANTSPVQSVSHAFYPVRQDLKADLLKALLQKIEYDNVLIFTRTKHKAKNLTKFLINSGHSATFLQGNMSQSQRQRALSAFQRGTFKIMVATDIASRGIDCDRITHVINFDAPDSVETYTHRIGRTGRAGRTGEALNLVTRDDQRLMRDIERIVRQRIAVRTIDGFEYNQPVVRQTESDRPERTARPVANRSHKPDSKRPANRTSGRGRGRYQAEAR